MSVQNWKDASFAVGWLVIGASSVLTLYRRSAAPKTPEFKMLVRISGLLLGIAFLISSR